MGRTALLLGILALLGGAAAWLALGGGTQPAAPGGLPGENRWAGGKGGAGEGKVPFLPGERRKIRTGRPQDRPPQGKEEIKGILDLLVTCSDLGGGLEAEIKLVSPEGRVLGRVRSGPDGRARLGIPLSLPRNSRLVVDDPRCLPWSAPLPKGKNFLSVKLQGACRLGGKVLGKDGNPAEGAQVFVENGVLRGKGPFALTGKDGTFLLERAPPGRAKVTCVLGGEARTKVVSLEPGRRGEVLFDFTPRVPLLEGFLLDSAGLPLGGWWLEVLENPGGGQVLARTGKEGEFQVELSGPTGVDLFAAEKKDPEEVRVFLGSFQVGEEGLSGLRLALGRGGIRGRVVLEEGGTLPEGARVAAWRMEKGGFQLAGQVGKFDPEGRFLMGGLKDGAYRLSVQVEGYPDLLTWVGPLDGGVRDLGDLVLTKRGAGDLVFSCRGKGGPPPRTFQAWRKEGDALVPLELVPRGKRRFLARFLPAGKVGLRIEAEGFVPGDLEVEIQAGKVSRITLEFVRGYPVTIQVTAPGGGKVEKVFGRFDPKGPWIPAKPAGPGLWAFPSLPRGTYTLLVKSPGFRAGAVDIQVPVRETPAARVELFR